MELHLPGHRGAAVSDRGHAGVLVAEMANPSPDPITMLILGGACAALVEVAEFIVWSNDRRRARQHPSPYAGLADDELSPLDPGGQRAASPCACYGFVTSGCLDSMSWPGLPLPKRLGTCAETFGHRPAVPAPAVPVPRFLIGSPRGGGHVHPLSEMPQRRRDRLVGGP